MANRILCEHKFHTTTYGKGIVHKPGTLVGKFVFHGGMNQQLYAVLHVYWGLTQKLTNGEWWNTVSHCWKGKL